MARKISPEKFSNALELIEIKKIGFTEITSKLYVQNLKDGEIVLDANNDVEIQTEGQSKTLAAIDKYRIVGKIKDALLFEIKLDVMVIFEAKAKVDPSFIKLFEETTLKVITYPYAREAIQDLTTKMGISPLILPMWRAPSRKNIKYLKPSTNGH